jgi:membrane protein implicated in regulation of membrane protease activity
MWRFWLILSGILLVVEIINVGFLVFWFSMGALIAMICSFFIDNVVVQAVVFLVSSTLLLFLTKPFVKKFTSNDNPNPNSAVPDQKTGKVIIDIDPAKGKGQVLIGTEKWSAKSAGDTFISKDTEVIVEKVDGVKVVVRPIY